MNERIESDRQHTQQVLSSAVSRRLDLLFVSGKYAIGGAAVGLSLSGTARMLLGVQWPHEVLMAVGALMFLFLARAFSKEHRS